MEMLLYGTKEELHVCSLRNDESMMANQNYYWKLQFNDLVSGVWKKKMRILVGKRISEKKRQNKKPKYINDED
ncbi:hypothetical protein YC2023_122347 [Brassica napus]